MVFEKLRQRTLEEAVRALATSPVECNLLGEVVGLCLPYVEQGVENLFKQVADDPRGLGQFDQAIEEFLAEKLGNPEFIDSLAKADAPGPFLATSAYNFADSLLRRRGLQRDTTGLEPGPGAEVGGRLAGGHADVSAGHEERALVVERNAAMRRVLDELLVENRALLKVLFVCDAALDNEEVAFLAGARGVSADVVRQEMAARAEHMGQREQQLEQSLDERVSYVRELRERRYRMARIIAEIDGEPIASVAMGGIETHVSDRKAREATREWRSGQLAALDARIAQWERLIEKEYASLTEPLHGRPNYQEAALILGYARPGDSAERIRTKANKVQVDANRLLAKMGERFCEENE